MCDLLIVGAGPKAAAIGARCAALTSLGRPAPTVVAADPLGVGGYWIPDGGWTDGLQRLGTAPEKDLGFPYTSADAELDEALFSFSWCAHLRHRGTYDSWIDRGRPAPTHREWAEYLRWGVARSGMPVIRERVTELEADGAGWLASLTDGSRTRVIRSRSVMITGPGPATRRITQHPAVWSLARFWSGGAAELRGRRIVILGAGESAASAVAESVRADAAEITIVAPGPTVFSRGESYLENRVYTHPDEWGGLAEADRHAVIARTDRGVFSKENQGVAALFGGLRFARGAAVSVLERDGGVIPVDARGATLSGAADIVVDARGGDATWFLGLLGADAAAALPSRRERDLERRIDWNCRVEDMSPPLFLPTLAAFRQGPGLANLSCLGTLAGRVVDGVDVLAGDRGGVGDRPAVAVGPHGG